MDGVEAFLMTIALIVANIWLKLYSSEDKRKVYLDNIIDLGTILLVLLLCLSLSRAFENWEYFAYKNLRMMLLVGIAVTLYRMIYTYLSMRKLFNNKKVKVKNHA